MIDYTNNPEAMFRGSKHAGARPRVEVRVKFGAGVKVIVNRDILTVVDPSTIPPPPYGASEAVRVAYTKQVDKATSLCSVVRNTGPKQIRISTKGFIDMSIDEWKAFVEAVNEAIDTSVDLPPSPSIIIDPHAK
jgi:phosphosulfolactate synthase (CoM biosynthesis protein A)